MTEPVTDDTNELDEKFDCLIAGQAKVIGELLRCLLESELTAALARVKHLQAILSGSLCDSPETQGISPSESIAATPSAAILE
jgi:hypothetical protein